MPTPRARLDPPDIPNLKLGPQQLLQTTTDYYRLKTEVFLARPVVEASLWDSLIRISKLVSNVGSGNLHIYS